LPLPMRAATQWAICVCCPRPLTHGRARPHLPQVQLWRPCGRQGCRVRVMHCLHASPWTRAAAAGGCAAGRAAIPAGAAPRAHFYLATRRLQTPAVRVRAPPERLSIVHVPTGPAFTRHPLTPLSYAQTQDMHPFLTRPPRGKAPLTNCVIVWPRGELGWGGVRRVSLLPRAAKSRTDAGAASWVQLMGGMDTAKWWVTRGTHKEAV
jgi:hypothetical protein